MGSNPILFLFFFVLETLPIMGRECIIRNLSYSDRSSSAPLGRDLQTLFFFVKIELSRFRNIDYYGRRRRYGDDHYKCATGDVENGVALEGLADGYRGTEQLKSYQVSCRSFFFLFFALGTMPIMEENSRRDWSKWLKFMLFHKRKESHPG